MRYEGPRHFQELFEQTYRQLRGEGHLKREGEPTLVIGEVGTLQTGKPLIVTGYDQSIRKIEQGLDAMLGGDISAFAQVARDAREATLVRSHAAYVYNADFCLYSATSALELYLAHIARMKRIELLGAEGEAVGAVDYDRLRSEMLPAPFAQWEMAAAAPWEELRKRVAQLPVRFERSVHGKFSGEQFEALYAQAAQQYPRNRPRKRAIEKHLAFLSGEGYIDFVRLARDIFCLAEVNGDDPAARALFLKAQFDREHYLAFVRETLDQAYALRKNPFELVT